MKINFFKMQAQGNDYIYIDLKNNDKNFCQKKFSEIARFLSRRHYSVGGDGLVALDKSDIADIKMIMFNRDGSRGAVCGNALRCVGYYVAKKLGVNNLTVETDVGVKEVTVFNNLVTVNMGVCAPLVVDIHKLYSENICAYLDSCVFYEFSNIGNNHLTVFVENEKISDNGLIAPRLVKTNDVFDDINVEIVVKNKDGFNVSVYERGSGKTLCCGSGAAAVYASLLRRGIVFSKKTRLDFDGGSLFLSCYANEIYLSGNVSFCYEGVTYYD